MSPARPALLVVALLVGASPALAHTGGELGGLTSGLLHPITGLDHVVAMVAVGLWGGILRGAAIWLLPIVFPLVMALGGAAGVAGVPLPGVEAGIALSGVVLGLMVVLAARPPLWVGRRRSSAPSRSSTDTPMAPSCRSPPIPAIYAVGFVVATGLLHLTGIAIGQIGRWRDRPRRGAGRGRGDRARRRRVPDRRRMIRLLALAGRGAGGDAPPTRTARFRSGGGFYAGALHPLLALEHLLLLLALGLLLGRRPDGPARAPLIGLAVGARGRAGARRAGLAWPAAPLGILVGAILAGLAVAAGAPVPSPGAGCCSRPSRASRSALDTGVPPAVRARPGLPYAGVFVGVFLIVLNAMALASARAPAALPHRRARGGVLDRRGGGDDAGAARPTHGRRRMIALARPRRRALAGVAAAIGRRRRARAGRRAGVAPGARTATRRRSADDRVVAVLPGVRTRLLRRPAGTPARGAGEPGRSRRGEGGRAPADRRRAQTPATRAWSAPRSACCGPSSTRPTPRRSHLAATARQYQHDFPGALDLLDRALALSPRDADGAARPGHDQRRARAAGHRGRATAGGSTRAPRPDLGFLCQSTALTLTAEAPAVYARLEGDPFPDRPARRVAAQLRPRPAWARSRRFRAAATWRARTSPRRWPRSRTPCASG